MLKFTSAVWVESQYRPIVQYKDNATKAIILRKVKESRLWRIGKIDDGKAELNKKQVIHTFLKGAVSSSKRKDKQSKDISWALVKQLSEAKEW